RPRNLLLKIGVGSCGLRTGDSAFGSAVATTTTTTTTKTLTVTFASLNPISRSFVGFSNGSTPPKPSRRYSNRLTWALPKNQAFEKSDGGRTRSSCGAAFGATLTLLPTPVLVEIRGFRKVDRSGPPLSDNDTYRPLSGRPRGLLPNSASLDPRIRYRAR